MISDAPPWSIRTALISVHDVDRSVAFYKDVMNFHDVRRDGQLAALGGDTTRPFTLLLRQAHRNAILSGQGLGVRALTCDVGSVDELDRVQERLGDLGAFRDRLLLGEADKLEVVRGHDPDRLALTFIVYEAGRIPPLNHDRTLAQIYLVDL